MLLLIIIIMLFAASNAIMGACGEREGLRWGAAGYWVLVLIYWMVRTVEMGSV